MVGIHAAFDIAPRAVPAPSPMPPRSTDACAVSSPVPAIEDLMDALRANARLLARR